MDTVTGTIRQYDVGQINTGECVSTDQLTVFAYLTAEKAERYRQVMRAFLHAKQRFVLHLRPDEVVTSLHDDGTAVDRDGVQTLLAQLVEWGNLRADPDTAEVATVEEFYRARFLYQLTLEGEAAERAVAHFEDLLVVPGELQTSALADIQELLAELLGLARAEAPDPGKVHRSLTTLTTRLEELTDRARTFITGLQRTVDLHGIDLEAFLAYKDRLIEYLERFIGDLVVAQGRIATLLADIDAAGSARLLALAAERDLADRLEVTEADRAAVHARWSDRWAGLTAWFVAPTDDRAQADVLRERARRAIPALLQAVSQINQRRVSRTDRPADLRTLARWFAQCPSDADAHRLWRAAFGLSPSRHLKVDGDTLDARADEPVRASISWLDAPPLQVSPQLRRTGHYVRRGRPASIVDRSAEKALLARQAELETAQLADARAQLVTDGTVRLSELGHLDPAAFGAFLDLLGEALSASAPGVAGPDRAVRVTSADGGLEIRLTPTDDDRQATIVTTDGALIGPDHHVAIVDLTGTDLGRPRRATAADDVLVPEEVGA
ncbi:MAG: TIGR02677 family protein [Nitriliruptor sp.]|uniref:TIGR02677 family protein n=1 Tax=Nitriliruptor sp. TaxID=2448056 RepID=UPI0034A0A725